MGAPTAAAPSVDGVDPDESGVKVTVTVTVVPLTVSEPDGVDVSV